MSQKSKEEANHGYFMKVFQPHKSVGGSRVKLNIHYFNDKYQKEEIYCRHFNFTSAQSILAKIKNKFDKIDRMEIVSQKSPNKNIEIVDDEDLLVSILRFQLYTREEECKHGLDLFIKSS